MDGELHQAEQQEEERKLEEVRQARVKMLKEVEAMGPETSLDYNVAHLAAAQAQMSQSARKVKTTTIFDTIDANFKKAARRCRECEAALLKRMDQAT